MLMTLVGRFHQRRLRLRPELKKRRRRRRRRRRRKIPTTTTKPPPTNEEEYDFNSHEEEWEHDHNLYDISDNIIGDDPYEDFSDYEDEYDEHYGAPLYVDDLNILSHRPADDHRNHFYGWTDWVNENDQESMENFDYNNVYDETLTFDDHYQPYEEEEEVDFYEDKQYEYIDGDEMEDFKSYFKNHRNHNQDWGEVLPEMEQNFKVLNYDDYEYLEIGVLNFMKPPYQEGKEEEGRRPSNSSPSYYYSPASFSSSAPSSPSSSYALYPPPPPPSPSSPQSSFSPNLVLKDETQPRRRRRRFYKRPPAFPRK